MGNRRAGQWIRVLEIDLCIQTRAHHHAYEHKIGTYIELSAVLREEVKRRRLYTKNLIF